MKNRITILAVMLLITISVVAQLSMPKVFSSHMVLQRDIEIPIWGNAPAGAIISVQWGKDTVKGITDPTGKWMIHLPKTKAGGPFSLKIYASSNANDSLLFNDVLVGDVWFASGQSNMEMKVQESKNARMEIVRANHPSIRFFKVPHAKSLSPETDVQSGAWSVCDSNSVRESSAVAYFFARQVTKEAGVPVGIIQSTWGGTPVESWTSKEALLSSISRKRVQANDTVTIHHFTKDSLDLIRFWDIVYHPKNETDKRIPNLNHNDSAWATVRMPSTLKQSGLSYYEGMVWLRKSIVIPPTFSTQKVIIHLGHPEMNYTLYFNGVEICKNVWNAQATHTYSIPPQLIKHGENQITVRMAYLWGGGGFNPPSTDLYLSDGKTKLLLAGQWKYQRDLEPTLPKIHNYHYYPSFLYNAMIHPIVPYGLKGFLWYQGEANDTAAYAYQQLFPLMINDWRVRWKQGYLPFLFVQLPNFKKRESEPKESEWAEMREAQAMALLQPNSGMACAIDLGEANDIHPKNKQDVAYRLALAANKLVYRKKGVTLSPTFEKMVIDSSRIRIHFTEVGNGLITNDHLPVRAFTIAGADKKFYPAKAIIEGNQVIVSSDKVTQPVAVRYAWSDNPDVNLVNSATLPAVPFRTDRWRGTTER